MICGDAHADISGHGNMRTSMGLAHYGDNGDLASSISRSTVDNSTAYIHRSPFVLVEPSASEEVPFYSHPVRRL